MPIRKLWGVGEVMGRELAKLGIETIGDLARRPREELVARFGVASGEGLYRASHGLDDSPVTPEHEAKSLSREETFARDIRDAGRAAPRAPAPERRGRLAAAAAPAAGPDG